MWLSMLQSSYGSKNVMITHSFAPKDIENVADDVTIHHTGQICIDNWLVCFRGYKGCGGTCYRESPQKKVREW